MATLTKTKNRAVTTSKIQPKKAAKIEDDASLDDETETSEGETVVVSSGLATLCQQWQGTLVKGRGYWLQIVRYCIDNETSREELKAALMDIRKMAKLTAANEVSKIFKAVERPDLVEKAEKGKLTVEALREQITKKQEGSTKPDVQLSRSLKRIAAFGIDKLDLDLETFLGEAEEQYKAAEASISKKRKDADEDSEAMEDSDADDSDDEGEVEEDE